MITVEEIQDKKYTIIWHDPFYHTACMAFLIKKMPVGLAMLDPESEKVIATALPALPKQPKPEDAKLLYRYMAEGITPISHESDWDGMGRTEEIYRTPCDEHFCMGKITHATYNGERVGIALEGDHE